MDFMCGTAARPDEPKLDLFCCSVHRRTIKNVVMFIVVMVVYIGLLTMIMGPRNNSHKHLSDD